MRFISKQAYQNYQLNKSSVNPPISSDEATRRWQRFPDKSAVLQQLLAEQYQLCCYSELRADQEGIGYHIEHVKPKSQYPELTFDYQNLTASAIQSEVLSQLKEETFAGHAKLSQYDSALFVSCLQHGSAQYFRYLSDGRVIAAEEIDLAKKQKATYTISLLNLNSPYLVNRRRIWWEELEELFTEHLTNDMSLHYLAGIDLLPTNQTISPFFSLTRQFFGHIGESVLQEGAPELL